MFEEKLKVKRTIYRQPTEKQKQMRMQTRASFYMWMKHLDVSAPIEYDESMEDYTQEVPIEELHSIVSDLKSQLHVATCENLFVTTEWTTCESNDLSDGRVEPPHVRRRMEEIETMIGDLKHMYAGVQWDRER
tara:strand:+ start:330 stop:728 length:399 start_codon:yes stop_codon:yes gene_type:complete